MLYIQIEVNVAKACRICESESNGFYKDSSSKDGYENVCKLCSVEKAVQYGKNHPDWLITRQRISRLRRTNKCREFIKAYLENHPCIDCGEKDIVVLEFDHVSGAKISNISNMIGDACSIAQLQLEIEKCEVRCANCHRRKTAKQFGWYKHEET